MIDYLQNLNLFFSYLKILTMKELNLSILYAINLSFSSSSEYLRGNVNFSIVKNILLFITESKLNL